MSLIHLRILGERSRVGHMYYQKMPSMPHTMYISWVNTEDSWQGKGIGKALMMTALNKIRTENKDAKNVLLKVKGCEERGGNVPAEKLYTSCGFLWTDPKDHTN